MTEQVKFHFNPYLVAVGHNYILADETASLYYLITFYDSDVGSRWVRVQCTGEKRATMIPLSDLPVLYQFQRVVLSDGGGPPLKPLFDRPTEESPTLEGPPLLGETVWDKLNVETD